MYIYVIHTAESNARSFNHGCKKQKNKTIHPLLTLQVAKHNLIPLALYKTACQNSQAHFLHA